MKIYFFDIAFSCRTVIVVAKNEPEARELLKKSGVPGGNINIVAEIEIPKLPAIVYNENIHSGKK